MCNLPVAHFCSPRHAHIQHRLGKVRRSEDGTTTIVFSEKVVTLEKVFLTEKNLAEFKDGDFVDLIVDNEREETVIRRGPELVEREE